MINWAKLSKLLNAGVIDEAEFEKRIDAIAKEPNLCEDCGYHNPDDRNDCLNCGRRF